MGLELLDVIEQGLAPKQIGIQEFAESKNYCNRILYPRQVVLLKVMFLEELTGEEEDVLDEWIAGGRNSEIIMSPNIRERMDYLRGEGYKHFREVQLVGGRRSSKGFSTGIALAKIMFDTLQLGDPRDHYNIESPEIFFSCIAGSETQAKEFQYADFVTTVENCKAFEPYLLKSLETEFRVATPSDLRDISANRARGNKIQRDLATLQGTALASNAGTLRGSTTMAAAQPLSARVLTPEGWIAMGKLRVGDDVIGSDGRAQKILKLHPQGNRPVFSVTFSDGSSTECTGDHLWTLRQKRDTYRTKPLEQFMFDLHKRNGKQRDHAKWALPPAPVVQYDSQPLPLHPYLLGALIGDGGYSGRHVCLYSDEPDIADRVREVLPPGHDLIKDSQPLRYRIVNRHEHHNAVIRGLRLMGMMGTKGPQKSIPQIYKQSRPHERLALLQGLLDTDGSVSNTSVRFGSTSRQLAQDVIEVVRSLGGYATMGAGRSNRGNFGGEDNHLLYEVCISGLDATTLFRSERKQGRASTYSRYKRRSRRIVSVVPMGPRAVQCITVANDDGLYLTDDFLITHNCIDEMAHMIPGESKASADQVYNALTPSLDQFGIDGMLFLCSSPYSKVGRFYELFEANMRSFDPSRPIEFGYDIDGDPEADVNGDPRSFVFEYPSWALFERYRKYKSRWKQRERGKEWDKAVTVSPDYDPNEVDANGDEVHSTKDKQNILAARVEEAKNPEVYKVERRGKFAEVTDAYLNPTMVDQMYKGRPVSSEFDAEGVLIKRFMPFATNYGIDAINLHRYKFHLDPSSTTAGFGFAIGHIEYFVNPYNGDEEEHVIFDLIKRWDPKSFGGVIRWKPILAEVRQYAEIFRPYEITFDQHQSAEPIQTLQEQLTARNIHSRVYEVVATNELNWKRWEVLKTAMYQGLVHAPNDEDLTNNPTCKLELKFLQQVPTGGKFPKVEKQDIGPVRTKDQADCACEVVHSLIGNLMVNRLRDRLSTSAIVGGAQGGYGIGQGGPQGGQGPPGISGYYSTKQEKMVRHGVGQSPTRGFLGRGRSRSARSRGRF